MEYPNLTISQNAGGLSILCKQWLFVLHQILSNEKKKAIKNVKLELVSQLLSLASADLFWEKGLTERFTVQRWQLASVLRWIKTFLSATRKLLFRHWWVKPTYRRWRYLNSKKLLAGVFYLLYQVYLSFFLNLLTFCIFYARYSDYDSYCPSLFSKFTKTMLV